MFRDKIIFTAITIMVIAVLLSCKKQVVSPIPTPKQMDQIYYTEKGTPYTIKTSTSSVMRSTANHIQARGVRFHFGPIIPFFGDVTFLQIQTPQPIVPIMYNLAIYDLAGDGSTFANISTPYYTLQDENEFPLYDHVKLQAKMNPGIEKIFYNDDNNFAFGNKYGQAVLTDDDFLVTQNGLTMFFQTNQANGLANQPKGFGLPGGDYFVTVSFVYFELQKKQ